MTTTQTLTPAWRKTIENAATKAHRLAASHARRGHTQQAADYTNQARGLDALLHEMETAS